ncbi:hypothetical protein [Actinoplanes sp. NPDC049802]|uniref:hypothetical protein n=1 Tax=Actinoplanes sp. NPDC049802 TaxID=3154742 RepID=UPI0033F498F1
MAGEELIIKLTKDQAFVMSDWLYHMMDTPEFGDLVNEEPAVWSPLHTFAGTLGKSFVETFMPDYPGRLREARQWLLDSRREFDGPPVTE